MSETQNNELTEKDELAILKSKADKLNVSYHTNIGFAKLKEKINEAMATAEKEETPRERDMRLRKEARQLIRVNIVNMNPTKNKWKGEIITCGNAVVGTVKKFVPFNTPDGFHVERIILDYIKDRQYQMFYDTKDHRGRKIRKGKLVQEFNIQELAPLTKSQLNELAQRQAIAAGGGADE